MMIRKNKINSLVEDCWEFYGENGTYANIFKDNPITENYLASVVTRFIDTFPKERFSQNGQLREAIEKIMKIEKGLEN